ncbi:hypothetical protein RhiirA5_445754 [Rhizophagus irregularis]|uniref:Uncharacterized protein n=2 Tax=Rhizophagus irregularis TaxID=588596 RepID=A0A2N0NC58_9GLOM|nr:hypothetical protein RirG_083490 [Rhizophagus irregularis DAOM 197198w]PKB92166.1 hypothetical protein RhiirA5_445754 [Rhizophagus irregularis]UZO22170.1 hypothetical protein OCT59_014540 [Rhizophagus irregularis]GET55181.1 hypothetical protein GLOIN_2v1790077 [Rhizophagus irregularis DAOM 181602=DAOM 197198]
MSQNKKKSSNKRKLHKASKKVNRNRISTTPNTRQTSTTPSTGQTSTTPNTGQISTTPNTGQTSTPKKVDILIVLHYSIPLFKGVSFILTISKKFINTETNQYEKSAASKDKLSDDVEIIKVVREQISTTATGQVYQKNY